MIDIHSHVLAGFDDGARSMEESIRMVLMAYESGVSTLFATPHCNSYRLYHNYYDNRMMDAFRELKEELADRQIPVSIMLGMEVYACEEVLDLLQRGFIATLNQSRYLLMEFDTQKDLSLMDFLIDELKAEGYTPIIAHPERYPYIQKDPCILTRWLDQGCYLQINKGSINGGFGVKARKTALYLLDYHLVSFIASDAHRPDIRTPNLSEAYHYVCSHYSKEYADILFDDNPRCVIEDRELVPLH